MTDSTGTSTYQYDSLYRLVQHMNGAGCQVSYSSDLHGQALQLVYPAGIAVNRRYDDSGRLVSITDRLNNTTRFTYDAHGNIAQQSYPNGAVASFSYDGADRLVQVQDTSKENRLLNLTYARDNANRLTAENSTCPRRNRRQRAGSRPAFG